MRTMTKSNSSTETAAGTESIIKPGRTRKSARRQQPVFEDTFIRETRVNYVVSEHKLFQIRSAVDVASFVRSVLTDNSREHFVAMFLDSQHHVAAYSIVSIGTANSAFVTPREVFQRAIVAGAISIVVAHNHPSGSTQISDEDRKVTKRLFQSGELLGIRLLDHVVVTDRDYYSFSENGEM